MSRRGNSERVEASETYANVYFTAKQATYIRNKIRRQMEVPDKVAPEWSISPFDPNELIQKLPRVELNSTYKLKAYLYRAGGIGNGVIRAEKIGANTSLPEWNHYPGASYPYKEEEGTEQHIVHALELDGTARSYLTASILDRECQEYGVIWHGVNWEVHIILDDIEIGKKSINNEDLSVEFPWMSTMEWHKKGSYTFDPVVKHPSINTIIVQFYTFSELGEQAIYRHRDMYNKKTGDYKTETEVIATGAGGFMF